MAPLPLRNACAALLAIVSLSALSGSARAQFLSPGPLARSHAKVDSETTCNRCHVEGRKVGEDRCLSCHDKIESGLKANRGYHAHLVRSSGKACFSCHPDHQGRDFPLIRWDPKKADFQHSETGWPLHGAHEKTACIKCHTLPDHRYLIANTCVSCHEDVHTPSLGKDCANCHDESAFKPAPKFDHKKARYVLDGKHTQVACAKCHPSEPAGKKPSLKLRGIPFGKCNDCHKDPHNGDMEPAPCARCHTTRDFHEILAAARLAHAPGVFPLRNKHALVPCESCHKKGQSIKAAPTKCEGCHQSPHKAPFGNHCASCHSDRGWTSLVSTFQHELTGYALKGQHAEVACTRCHTGRGSYAQRFLGLRYDRCARCHADPHKIAYRSIADGTQCESCHVERGFVPSTFSITKHALTLFALDGSHVAVACADCHRTAPAAPTSNLTITLAASARFAMHPAAGDCVACHRNPHGDSFHKEMETGGCRGCHSAQAWGIARIDHDKTGFPLRGRHAEIACDFCHAPPAASATATGKPPERSFKGLDKACTGCHGDPHLGQFAATEPKKNCDACHGPAKWKELVFHHDRDARFPLEGKHAALKCEACHEKRKTPAGEVMVYRNGRIHCEDCHENHHERGDEWWGGSGT